MPPLGPVQQIIRALFDDLAPPPRYHAFLEAALTHALDTHGGAAHSLALDLPCAIGEALDTPATPSRHVAAAALLVWLGADLFDNVADEELDPAWRAWGEARVSLGAVTLLTVLPHRLLARLAEHGVPLATRQRLSDALTRALWQMSTGQFRDLESAVEGGSIATYEALLAGKSGAEIGLFAEWAALLAGRPDAEVDQWRALGTALGVAAQLASDVADVFAEPPGNDLRRGKHTAPVLYTRSTLTGEALAAFEADLRAARAGDEAALPRLQATMREAGALRYGALKAEVYRQKTLRLLRALLPDPARRQRLEALVGGFSLLTSAP